MSISFFSWIIMQNCFIGNSIDRHFAQYNSANTTCIHMTCWLAQQLFAFRIVELRLRKRWLPRAVNSKDCYEYAELSQLFLDMQVWKLLSNFCFSLFTIFATPLNTKRSITNTQLKNLSYVFSRKGFLDYLRMMFPWEDHSLVNIKIHWYVQPWILSTVTSYAQQLMVWNLHFNQ